MWKGDGGDNEMLLVRVLLGIVLVVIQVSCGSSGGSCVTCGVVWGDRNT